MSLGTIKIGKIIKRKEAEEIQLYMAPSTKPARPWRLTKVLCIRLQSCGDAKRTIVVHLRVRLSDEVQPRV
jgi:hypothetical protein